MNLSFRSCLLDEQTGQLSIRSIRPDAYEVFGLAYVYDIDQAQLESRYIEISRLTHPDHQCPADEAEKHRITKISAWINQSYKDLKNSLYRAEFLLDVLEKRHVLITDSKKLPDAFLMEMLELQEELEYFEKEPIEERLNEIESEAMDSRISVLKKVGDQIDGLIGRESLDQCDLQALRTQLNTVRYYDRILDTVEKIMDKI